MTWTWGKKKKYKLLISPSLRLKDALGLHLCSWWGWGSRSPPGSTVWGWGTVSPMCPSREELMGYSQRHRCVATACGVEPL